MTADASITITWAGEERRFRLAIGQLRELQEIVNSRRGAHPIGPWSLYQLISNRDAWPDDLRDVIRLGLMGGGTKAELIPGLVKRYVDERPLFESVPVALAVLGVALVGVPDDPAGKKPPVEDPTLSDFPISTAAAPPSDSLRNRSTSVPSGNSQHVSKDTIAPTAATTNPNQ